MDSDSTAWFVGVVVALGIMGMAYLAYNINLKDNAKYYEDWACRNYKQTGLPWKIENNNCFLSKDGGKTWWPATSFKN